jgi:hypothetical protein
MFPIVGATTCLARGVLLGTLIVGLSTHGIAQAVPPLDGDSPTPTLAMRDGELAASVHRAVRGAARLLEQPACAEVLDEFSDAGGRPLRDVLDTLTLSPTASLSRMIFRDGRDHRACRRGGLVAFTGPGSRVVFVCGNRFGELDRLRAQHVVIHEMLHTLGLGERPPASGYIDRAVARRCTG